MKKVVVIVILLMMIVIAFFVSGTYRSIAEQRKYNRAKKEMEPLNTAIAMYAQDYDWVSPKTGVSLGEFASYCPKGQSFKDPWGNDYVYQCPGIAHPTGYDLVSYGSDGRPGGTGTAKDLVLGRDGTAPVELAKVVKILCAICAKGVSQTQEKTTLSYNAAQKHRLADGSYRQLYEQGTKDRQLCEACQERIEARTKLPLLIGKNKSEVADILGTPDSSYASGIGYWELTWIYEDKPTNFRTHVYFRGPWNDLFKEADFTKALCNNVQIEAKNRNMCPIAEQIVPSKLLGREPDRINVRPAYNQLEVIWYSGKNTYILDVIPRSGEKVFTISKKVDLKTGDVRDIYHSSGVDWRQCLVLGFFQKDLHLDTGTMLEEAPRIK